MYRLFGYVKHLDGSLVCLTIILSVTTLFDDGDCISVATLTVIVGYENFMSCGHMCSPLQ